MTRGLTLVELLVAVLLLGAAAGGVALGVRGTTDPARLRSATLELEQALRLGRQWTARRHAPAWVQMERGTGRYRLVTDAAGAWHVLPEVSFTQAGPLNTEPASGPLCVLRIAPTGATLPWAAELRCGTRRRIVWSDGITGQLRHSDDVRWEDEPWRE
ncbi:MAG: prepilin-type N-terminal cleavage/methylation domain-containing protein [Planctomycetota bacterium]